MERRMMGSKKAKRKKIKFLTGLSGITPHPIFKLFSIHKKLLHIWAKAPTRHPNIVKD